MTWVIETQPGFVIEIDFTDFYLEASYDEDLGGKCVYDYVTTEMRWKDFVVSEESILSLHLHISLM